MTRCHTLKGRVNDHAHRICWVINGIREGSRQSLFVHNMDLLTKKNRPITHNLHQKYSKYLCKSVMRVYLIFKGKNYRQHNNASIKSLVLLRYLASFLLLFPSWTSLTNQHPYLKRKNKKRNKQSNSSLTSQGSIPPCNTHHYFYICKESYIHTNPRHINTYP